MQPELDPMTWALVAVGLVIAAGIFVRDLKRGRAYEWEPRPPNVRERIVCAIWLVAFVIAAVNYYASWHLFGHYDKWVFGGLFFVGLFLINRLPGVKRV